MPRRLHTTNRSSAAQTIEGQTPRLFAFDWETATTTVTGSGSYNGIPYYNVTVTPETNTDISATFAVNQAYPFALGWSSSGSATAIDTGVLILKSTNQ
jgi:hypothetical protein